MTSIIRIEEIETHSLEDLRNESLREGFGHVARLCEDWASGFNRFNAPGEALFVALAGNEIVGVCGLNCDPYTCDARVGRIRRLYVARAHRRRGVGRALLNAVVTHARAHFKVLRVRTEEAGKFFSAQGFGFVTLEAETTHVLELSKAAEHELEHRASNDHLTHRP